MKPAAQPVTTATTTHEILQSTNRVTIINPSPQYFKHILELLSTHFTTHGKRNKISRDTQITIYTTNETVSTICSDFIHRAVLTELRNTNKIDVYETGAHGRNIVLTTDTAYIAAMITNQIALFSTTNEETLTAITEHIKKEKQSRVKETDSKPYTEIKQQLIETTNESFITSFEAGVDEVLKRDTELPIQQLFVVVAAYEDTLQKQVSEGLSEAGVASIAGVSRAKKELQNKGVITTMKVPVDVGRPKHRLQLTENTRNNTESIGDVITHTIETINS